MRDHITRNTTFRTIELTIKPDGQTVLQTKGFSGSECREASRFLEQALGQATAEQPTAEFHQAAESESLNREQR